MTDDIGAVRKAYQLLPGWQVRYKDGDDHEWVTITEVESYHGIRNLWFEDDTADYFHAGQEVMCRNLKEVTAARKEAADAP